MKSIQALLHKVLLFLAISITFFSCAGENSGEGKREGKVKRVFLAADKTHEGWYFAAGDQVVIEGTVNGDTYIAGGVVEIDGTINGDLLVFGGQVSFTGTVSDDIRVAGGTVRVNGKVGKNVSAGGGTVTIGKMAVIEGAVLTACGSFQVAGKVSREVKVAAGDMNVTGTILGNLDFNGNNLSVLQGAKIGGDIRARVQHREHVEVSEGTVKGNVDILTREARVDRRILGFSTWYFWFKILWAFSLLATGLVLTFVFPRQFMGLGSTIAKLPGKSFLWGIAGIILVPVITALLLLTIIGAPLGLFLFTIFLSVVYLSQLSFGVVLGQRLFGLEGKSRWNLFWAFAVGLLIVQALTFIPYIRPLVILGSLIFGSGAILLVLREAARSAKAGVVITEKL